MNYFQKYRFAILTIIILSVIVLSSAGTVVFLKLSHHPESKDQNNRKRVQISQFFKEELKLSAEQEKAFKAYRNQFFQNAKVIFDSLEKERILMIQELGKPNPDSTVLFSIADQMGALHAQLRRETIKNQLRIRSICTPEQIKKLNTINSEFIRPEGPRHRPEGPRIQIILIKIGNRNINC